MSDKFLTLSKKEQENIIMSGAQKLGRDPSVIEKDVWICWVLEHLFNMPNRLPMAFKGGTSLSKVFNVINRFSEDVDVTLDYRGFGKTFDLFSDGVSKTSLKKISEELKKLVYNHVDIIIKPYFSNLLKQLLGSNYIEPNVSEDGEKIWIYYPSAIEDSKGDYLSNSVLIEFGGGNITEPSQAHIIKPYLSDLLQELEFPTANVMVLSPLRTFWEKVTLIHVACHRKEYKANANRLSRHWYDLAALSRTKICDSAFSDTELLTDVIRYKKLFYDSPNSNYDACLSKAFRLIPNEQFLAELKYDFGAMLNSGMFYGQPPVFEDIITSIRNLEKQLNGIVDSTPKLGRLTKREGVLNCAPEDIVHSDW